MTAAEKARFELAEIMQANPELSDLTPAQLNDRLSSVLDTREAAARLGVAPITLAKRRAHRGQGPPFLRWGGVVRYQLRDLLLWNARHPRGATSEYPTTGGRPRQVT